jgi:hypothetical protein
MWLRLWEGKMMRLSILLWRFCQPTQRIQQGCGSGLIQSGSGHRYGSGSSNLGQSGFGYGSVKSVNPDPQSHWIQIQSRSGSTTLVYNVQYILNCEIYTYGCGSAAAVALTVKMIRLMHRLRLRNNQIRCWNSTVYRRNYLVHRSKQYESFVKVFLFEIRNFYIWIRLWLWLLLQRRKWCGSCTSSGSETIKFDVKIVRSYMAIIVRRSISYQTIRSKMYDVRNSKTK